MSEEKKKELQTLLTEYDNIYQKAKQQESLYIKEVIEKRNKQHIRFWSAFMVIVSIIWVAFFLHAFVTGKTIFSEMDFGIGYVVKAALMFSIGPVLAILMYYELTYDLNKLSRRRIAISSDELRDMINNTKYAVLPDRHVSCKECVIDSENDNAVIFYRFADELSDSSDLMKVRFVFKWERPLQEEQYEKEFTEIIQSSDKTKNEQDLTELLAESCRNCILQAYINMIRTAVADDRLLMDAKELNIQFHFKEITDTDDDSEEIKI